MKAIAGVLSLLDSTATQPALLDKALAADTPDDVKIALYRSLSASAKFFGNRLDGTRVIKLRAARTAEKAPEVKSAAAEATGALNLPIEAAQTMILDRGGASGGDQPK